MTDIPQAAITAAAKVIVEQLKPVNLSHVLKSWDGFTEFTVSVVEAAAPHIAAAAVQAEHDRFHAFTRALDDHGTPADSAAALYDQAVKAGAAAERQRIRQLITDAGPLWRNCSAAYVLGRLAELLDPAEPVGADAQPGELGTTHTNDA